MKMKISIITGASSGIGKRFVALIDKIEDCDEIWVVARSREKLEELESKTGKSIKVLALDLSKVAGINKLSAAINEAQPQIVALVNAAGFGKFGSFEDIPLKEQMNMVDLNCKALMAVTHICLPFMKKGSKVYEIASLSSYMPLPYVGVYAATKAFVLSFTRALSNELKARGIKVIAVCPGWTKTNFIDRAKTDDSVNKFYKLYTVDEVVERAHKDMERGRDVSICGFETKAFAYLSKILPHKLVMWIWNKQQGK